MFRQRLIILLVFIGYTGFAQDFCDPNEWVKAGLAKPTTGGFRILGAKAGCVPFQVAVEKTVGDNYRYIYTYKGGNPLTSGYMLFNETSTTYTEQGSYKILQYGANGSPSVFCDNVEVFTKPNMTTKECSGRKVVVTIPSDTINKRYDSFLINWGDGAFEPVAKSANMTITHQYANISPRIITLTGVYQNSPIVCEQPATKSVIPSGVDISAVAIRKVTLRNDGLIDVGVQGAQGVTAELQMASSNGVFANTGQNITKNDTSTFTVRNIDLKQAPFCFRLAANDGCENVGSTSNTVCTVSLEATAENKQNALKWTEYPSADGFQGYKVQRNGVEIFSTANKAVTINTDATITCGEQYCYQVVATIGKAQSVSQLQCVKAISNETPGAVRNAFASVLDNQQVEIRAVAPLQGATAYRYKTIFLRADAGSNDFKEIATKENTLTFTDANVKSSEQSYCYKIQYENACGNRSEPTPPICSILLESKKGTSINWTSELPFSVPVKNYVLLIFNESGTLISETDKAGNTSYAPDLDNSQQLFRYRILAYADGNAALSYSNYFTFLRNAQIYIPDAFTPNADNVNDVFLVKGLFINKFNLTIFNRWGNRLFTSESQQIGWDGTVNGQPAAEDTYIYKIEVVDALGQQFLKSGKVLLLR